MSRRNMSYTIGIDIGSTTVKVAVLDDEHHILFSDYQRHFADIKGTLARLSRMPAVSWVSLMSSRPLPVPAVLQLPKS